MPWAQYTQSYRTISLYSLIYAFFLKMHYATLRSKVIGFIIFNNLASPPFSHVKQIERQEYEVSYIFSLISSSFSKKYTQISTAHFF